ncbi:MoaD/ThiS family protein [Hyphococcus flavus]|uniref:Molybdopterin synthase sulfur carrier subunit n=1 Tax=Hyphococcus flavus TaxID=1866326 RepID=A0AAE9ZB78_9PROT|nr:MoaD/ThiS family protein [Hyphococcus flavus]WDI31343.1 MoaD/ThiS family protein [Hyphococcus flavus]
MARVLFFGKLSDLAGARERNVMLPSRTHTVSDLIDTIGEDDTVLSAALKESSVRVIINEKMADSGTAVSDRDEVAFLPPVSGG